MEIDEKEFSAKDLLSLAGLTYRQLHDWENRAGVLDSNRAAKEGWRKFSIHEVIALSICATVRRKLSLPLEKIGSLYLWLIGKNATEFDLETSENGERVFEELKPEIEALKKLEPDAREKILNEDPAWRDLLVLYLESGLARYKSMPVKYAYELIRRGTATYLHTDFKDNFIFDDQELAIFITRQPLKFYTDDKTKKETWKVFAEELGDPSITFPLNSIYTKLLIKAKIRPIGTGPKSFWELWANFREQASLSNTEMEVIRIIRDKEYQTVSVHVRDGNILKIDIEEGLSFDKKESIEKQIVNAIQAHQFQSISVQVRDGQVVHVSQKASKKLHSDDRKNLSQEKTTQSYQSDGTNPSNGQHGAVNSLHSSANAPPKKVP